MFIIGYMPMWALVILAFFLVLGILLFALGLRIDENALSLLGFVIILPMIVLLTMPSSLFTVESNNYNTVAPGFKVFQHVSAIDFNNMNDFVADSIGADKVFMTEDVTMEDVKSGKILDFIGFKDDAKVTGNVYFKDDTMVIFVDDGSASFKTVNVPLDK